jgi:hypothetical protein
MTGGRASSHERTQKLHELLAQKIRKVNRLGWTPILQPYRQARCLSYNHTDRQDAYLTTIQTAEMPVLQPYRQARCLSYNHIDRRDAYPTGSFISLITLRTSNVPSLSRTSIRELSWK